MRKDEKRSVLLEAEAVVNGPRRESYGHPLPNHQAIANLWNAYLNNRAVLGVTGPLTPQDVAQLMVLLKLARLQHSPDHRDSTVDCVGYFACIEIMQDAQ